jgi:hypothetical protein
MLHCIPSDFAPMQLYKPPANLTSYLKDVYHASIRTFGALPVDIADHEHTMFYSETEIIPA